MIPTYVVDELILRLASPRLAPRKLKAICRLLETDLKAALEPQPSAEHAAASLFTGGTAKFFGHIEFEFETRSGNFVRRVPARIVYASQGLDANGEIGLTVSKCEALTWDYGEPAPEWQQMPENALPDGLVQRLSEAVLDAVAEQQRTASSPAADTEA